MRSIEDLDNISKLMAEANQGVVSNAGRQMEHQWQQTLEICERLDVVADLLMEVLDQNAAVEPEPTRLTEQVSVKRISG